MGSMFCVVSLSRPPSLRMNLIQVASQGYMGVRIQGFTLEDPLAWPWQ
jgi:hypothetical protein